MSSSFDTVCSRMMSSNLCCSVDNACLACSQIVRSIVVCSSLIFEKALESGTLDEFYDSHEGAFEYER